MRWGNTEHNPLLRLRTEFKPFHRELPLACKVIPNASVCSTRNLPCTGRFIGIYHRLYSHGIYSWHALSGVCCCFAKVLSEPQESHVLWHALFLHTHPVLECLSPHFLKWLLPLFQYAVQISPLLESLPQPPKQLVTLSSFQICI